MTSQAENCEHLRIDNTRQSVICTTLHYSLVMCCRASYYIPNESLYFCLSNHINEIMIRLISRKLWILNQFFNLYFLNMNISLNNYTSVMKFWRSALNIAPEGTVSQNFDLGHKPIFHQNAKYLASGVGFGQCA